MPSTTTMEIDFEVHKLIEMERKSFDEPRLAALRRLLGLKDGPPTQQLTEKELRAWIGDGVTLPHGTALKMTYNRRTHEGQINDGKWVVDGQTFDSPSGAAVGVARTRDGRSTHLNGWNYWYAKLPGTSKWVLAKLLVKQQQLEPL